MNDRPSTHDEVVLNHPDRNVREIDGSTLALPQTEIHLLRMHRFRRVLIPLAVFVMLTLGCSAADLMQRPVASTPAPTRTLAPTFTPTPDTLQAIVIVTPPAGGTPGVIIIPEGMDPSAFIVPPPTATPTPAPTSTLEPGATAIASLPTDAATPIPGVTEVATETPTIEPPTPTATFTPTPSETPTPTLSPTPFIVLDTGFTALRTGPGVEYPLVAQLGPGIPISIVGRNTEGTWFQLCCVNGEPVWVAASSVRIGNDPVSVALVLAQAAPSPTWTATPTWTPTVTPTPTATPYPFELAIGPQFFPTNNEFMTIWAKLFIGTPPNDVPAEGYYLKVLFQGFDRPGTNDARPSAGKFEQSGPAGAGNAVPYNVKYEYTPPDPKSLDANSTQTRADLLGTGTWTVFVADGAGNQLSNAVTFTSAPGNQNREVYIGWARVR